MKVAIVHDFFKREGGAERVLKALAEIYPKADLFFILADENLVAANFPGRKVYYSGVQNWPVFFTNHFQMLTPFFPSAVESFDFSNYDLVISSSTCFAKGIITNTETLHICYAHSPMRFVWDYYFSYLADQRKMQERGLWSDKNLINLKDSMARIALHFIRIWDYEASTRPDYLISNSMATREKLRKYYHKNSKVIYPPASIHNDIAIEELKTLPEDIIRILKNENFYLIVAALSSYKNIDLAVKAFNNLQLPLVIVGEGKEKKYLEKIANKNTHFTGFVKDSVLPVFYQKCKAFLFPGEDDFGIAPVEALMYGKPVIALNKGGAKETVIENINGIFFDEPEVELLADAVRRFEGNDINFNTEKIKATVEKFDEAIFKNKIKNFIDKAYERHHRAKSD